MTATLINAAEVVDLEDGLTADALFAEVKQACHLKIARDGEVKPAVTFPWLENDNTNGTLSVRRDSLH